MSEIGTPSLEWLVPLGVLLAYGLALWGYSLATAGVIRLIRWVRRKENGL